MRPRKWMRDAGGPRRTASRQGQVAVNHLKSGHRSVTGPGAFWILATNHAAFLHEGLCGPALAVVLVEVVQRWHPWSGQLFCGCVAGDGAEWFAAGHHASA